MASRRRAALQLWSVDHDGTCTCRLQPSCVLCKLPAQSHALVVGLTAWCGMRERTCQWVSKRSYHCHGIGWVGGKPAYLKACHAGIAHGLQHHWGERPATSIVDDGGAGVRGLAFTHTRGPNGRHHCRPHRIRGIVTSCNSVQHALVQRDDLLLNGHACCPRGAPKKWCCPWEQRAVHYSKTRYAAREHLEERHTRCSGQGRCSLASLCACTAASVRAMKINSCPGASPDAKGDLQAALFCCWIVVCRYLASGVARRLQARYTCFTTGLG